MSEFSQFWDLVGEVLRLRPGAFQTIGELALGGRLAFVVVLLVGLSEALGESVVLFVNRVSPRRFAVSLLISAVLFAFTYLFVTLSIFVVARFIVAAPVEFAAVARVVGFSYAPRLFGFLEFLPFLGVPVQATLRAWSVLALLVGVGSALALSPGQALASVLLGSLLLLSIERTVGRPLIGLARWLRTRAAGVELVTDRRKLLDLIDAGPDRGLRPSGGSEGGAR